jgi:integrase
MCTAVCAPLRNLLVACVLDRVAQGVMGWSDASMAKRYQHLTKRVQAAVADRVEALLWDDDEAAL